eukprot:6720093-Pyramimonas_sp.AAC.1
MVLTGGDKRVLDIKGSKDKVLTGGDKRRVIIPHQIEEVAGNGADVCAPLHDEGPVPHLQNATPLPDPPPGPGKGSAEGVSRGSGG